MVGLLISRTMCEISKFETVCSLALEKRKGSAWVLSQIGKVFKERGKRAGRGPEEGQSQTQELGEIQQLNTSSLLIIYLGIQGSGYKVLEEVRKTATRRMGCEGKGNRDGT